MLENTRLQGFQVVLLPSRDTAVEEAPNSAPVVVVSSALTQAQRWQRQLQTSQGEEVANNDLGVLFTFLKWKQTVVKFFTCSTRLL
jgi:hypothetical protein